MPKKVYTNEEKEDSLIEQMSSPVPSDSGGEPSLDTARVLDSYNRETYLTSLLLLFGAFYGDGSDGDVTISIDTALTSDMFYDNLVINPGIVLSTGGYRVYCKTSIINYGTIRRNGNTGGDAGTGPPAAGGAALTGGTTGVSGAGGNGAFGGGGANGSDGGDLTTALGGAGGDGGDIGAFTGGVGGSVTAPSLGMRVALNLYDFIDGAVVTGGAGGGGGANEGAGGGPGGGGGSGGGVILIMAKSFTNYGTIEANGGDGGNGNDPVDSTTGGGGGGGLIFLVYNSLVVEGTITVNGGSTGTGGVVGNDGNDGTIIKLAI